MADFIRNIYILARTPSGTEGEVRGLDIEFSIELSVDSSPDAGIVKIYNLNESSRAKFEEEGTLVSLYAGYSNPGLIFRGQVTKSTSAPASGDWITTLTLTVAKFSSDRAIMDRAFPKGTPINNVLEQLADAYVAFGINKYLQLSNTQGRNIEKPISVLGKVKHSLDDICADYGYQWRVTQTELIIEPEGVVDARDGEIVPVVSALTGLMEIPSISTEGNKNVIEFVSNLNGRLMPNRRVRVDSLDPKYNGDYVIKHVVFSGGNTGNEFNTKVRGESVGG